MSVPSVVKKSGFPKLHSLMNTHAIRYEPRTENQKPRSNPAGGGREMNPDRETATLGDLETGRFGDGKQNGTHAYAHE